MPSKKLEQYECQEEIVISGISGRFPEADNIDELEHNLYNHVDMISEDDRRWPVGFYGLPPRNGKIKHLDKFDSQFFGVHGKQVDNMDPQARILLELTYEAIADAGINPQTLRGTRTGVFIGASSSEVEEALVSDINKATGYALTGCSRSMFANRVSFTFDFQGPSYTMDTACSSSFLAFQQAMLALRTNECDQAIVGGANICIRPPSSVQFNKLNMLSPDGKCQHLDSSANGYVRSETVSVVFLQRKSQAKRIYATVIHSKTNTDGFKEEGIMFPSWESQKRVMAETVEEAGINPLDVEYVEAHGTGTPAGDPIETKAISQVFCVGRKEPLLIGSVKSNLGHAEPASGINSIAKVLLTFKNKSIPANLHFKAPNPNVPELMNGLVKPVIENTPFEDGLIAINSFGFGGVNVHVVLKPHLKELDQSVQKIVGKIPRLILTAGRSEDSVNYIFNFIEKNPEKINREFLALLHDFSQTNESSGMNTRGFMLVDKHPDGETLFPKEAAKVLEKRPVWFVYSGMGSQWTSMAKALMAIDIFRESMERSAEILKDYDIDLFNLVLSNETTVLETTVAPFVAIASIQIALTDLIHKLGIEPDGIVGHSVGELGCAYADGVFDHKQMLLAAYWRGKCVEQGSLPKGMMAAVGLTWEEAKARCPEGVAPACHNSHDSVTISGRYDAMKPFVEQLQKENIFVREVKSSGIAYHSHFMEAIAPELLKQLEKIIPDKKLRSKRWLSSSFPEERWDEDIAKYSSAAYYVNNLTSPVLFHEAVQKIPQNAIVVEIAPHCLLQAVVKRTLGADISYVALMKRNNNEQNLNMLLSAIGKLYTLGLNPDITVLYPKVEYPVSRNIQSLSSLIKWDHSQNWLVTLYPEYFNPNNLSDYSVKIDLQDKQDKFYVGHRIDGRILFPATGYLYLAWQMLAKTKGQFCEKIPVEFENVTLHRATILHEDNPVKFDIRLMEVNGEFTISESGTVVVTGRIYQSENSPLKLQCLLTDGSVVSSGSIKLETRDVYKDLSLRGYDYGPTFQGIVEANSDSKFGKIKFTNWIVLADNMLQLAILGGMTRGLYLPVRFQSVRCDPKILFETVKQSGEEAILNIVNDRRINAIVAPGLEIQGIKTNLAPRRMGNQVPVLEKYEFTPYSEQCISDLESRSKLSEYISVTSQIADQVVDSLKISIPKSNVQVEEKVLKKYLDSISDYPILSILHKLATNPKEEINEDLSFDPLLTASETQHYIGVLIDLVVENVTSSKLNLVEVNDTGRILFDAVKHWIETSNYDASINYALLTSKDAGSEKGDFNHSLWKREQSLPVENEKTDMLVYKDMNGFCFDEETINLETLFTSFHKAIKLNGFLLAIFRSKLTHAENLLYQLKKAKFNDKQVEMFISEAEKYGFHLISDRHDNLTTSVLLFRKIDNSINANEQTVINITASDYGKWLELLKTKIIEHQKMAKGQNIWLMANDDPVCGVVGLVKCLRKEPGGDRIRCILNSGLNQHDTLPDLLADKPIFSEIVKKDLMINVYRQKQFGSFRHYNINAEPLNDTEHAYLNVALRGDLSSLKWYESEHKYWPKLPTKIQKSYGSLYTVYYAPLNFRDIMLATGKLPPDALPGDLALQDCILGLEFSGRNEKGERVMGMVPAKGLATTVIVNDEDFVWPIPDHWTMEEAATVPVVYSTAYYALVVRGELESGESVLIHSGSGGVGQAAIAICLSMNCKVFTTVGSEEKKNYLKQRFPQLTDDNFAYSRNTSFEQHILRKTNGRGVDVILNSLAEEKLQASVRCLAQHGRFLEIGKYDLSQNNPLGMAAFLKNITFHGILLDALLDPSESSPIIEGQKKMVRDLISTGIKNGTIRPLKSNLYDMDRAEDSFRFMASGKHIGKVVLRIREEESQKVFVPPRRLVSAVARTMFLPTKSYIVTGGLGGFGLELSRWLVERGAKKLVLSSRNGATKPYQKMCLKWFSENGAQCQVSKASITTKEGAKQLIEESEGLAPVGGIFNLAMVLNDGFFENQNAESFEKVCAPKVQATKHLDSLSREKCPDLDYFVCFSSVSCGRGNAGQTNYGFANSSMERICELRRAAGLHGLAVQWGAIGDVGVVSENLGGNEAVIGGTVPQRMPSCLSVLDRFLQAPEAVCCSLVRAKRQQSNKDGNKQDLIKSIAHILGIKNPGSIPLAKSLAELGMDSLMGVEVKQFLERDFDVILSLQELRALTMSSLKELVGDESSSPKTQTIKELPKTSLAAMSLRIPEEKYVKLNDVESGRPVFFLPPVEGHFNVVKVIASQLKRPAFGLNWTIDLLSINQASSQFVELAKNLNGKDETFDLIGYSMGSILAFDLALRLQAEKQKVNMIFLDGSPSYLQNTSLEIYRRITGVEVDEYSRFREALIYILLYTAPLDHSVIREEFANLKTRKQMTNRASEILIENGIQSEKPEDLVVALEFNAAKFSMMHEYEAKQKYAGDCLLIRASETIIRNTNADEDYGVSKIITGTCNYHILPGNHQNFIENNSDKILSFINTQLE